EVLRRYARRRLALYVDTLDAVAIQEVVDVGSAPGCGHRGVHIGERQAHRANSFIVDDDLVLRLIVHAVGPYHGECRMLRSFIQELVPRLHQRVVSLPAAILQEEVEPRGVTELLNGRRRERNHHGVTVLRKFGVGARHDGEYVLALTLAVFPW